MKEDEDTKYEGGGLKGPLYWLAGVATAAVAGQNGILGGILGGPRPGGPGAPMSTRETELAIENQGLKSRLYTNELNTAQVAWNAKQEGRIECLERGVAELRSAFRLTLPNENLTPGVGPVQVVPVPPVPPAAPDVATIVAATVAAMQKTSGTAQATNP